MSKTLRPIPIRRMLEHMARELEMSSCVFSVAPGFRGSIGGESAAGLELPLGVTAGPSTRTAQSLTAAYGAGARSFELMTVSDSGADLDAVLEEAVKASVAIQLLGRELGLGRYDGVGFGMVVPCDETALTGPAFADLFAAMEDASATALWQDCALAARELVRRFTNLNKSDAEGLDPHISATAILEPCHDPADIQAAAGCLLERGLDVYITLGPTALGPTGMGACLAAQGGEDLPLDKAAFGPDLLSLGPVIDSLRERAAGLGRKVGLRVAGDVPLTDGKALWGPAAAPVTLLLAARAAGRWPDMPVIWAGETDYFNAAELRHLGFACVNAGSVLRRPGGLGRLRQLARVMAATPGPAGLDGRGAEDLARAWSRRERCRVDRPAPQRVRIPKKLPLMDCFTAPCQAGCPFGQDITGALRLMSDGRYRDALAIILDKNPLPNLTGALCPQPCQSSCTRIFYDQAIQVRQAEAQCVRQAWADLLPRLTQPEPDPDHRVAVVGGSMAGMAVSILLARRGVAVTLFESGPVLCPTVRQADRELGALVDRDARVLELTRADVRLSTPAPAVAELLKEYTHVVLAPEPGQAADGQMRLPGTEEPDQAGGEDLPAERVFAMAQYTDEAGGIARIIADAHDIADALLGPAPAFPHPAGRRGGAMGKKGKVCPVDEVPEECERCLECATVCECCVDACPNRANVAVSVLTRGTPQILHLDALCDHCGVCGRFCPYDGAPDREKFTLFETVEDFENSENAGFVVLDFLARKVRLRLEGQIRDLALKNAEEQVPAPVRELMETVFTDYPYLLDTARRKESDQVSLF